MLTGMVCALQEKDLERKYAAFANAGTEPAWACGALGLFGDDSLEN